MNKLAVAFLCALHSTLAFAQPPSVQTVVLKAGEVRMEISLDRFRFGFFRAGAQIATPHPDAGILVAGAPLSHVVPFACAETACSFSAQDVTGSAVSLHIDLASDDCTLMIAPLRPASVLVRTGGIAPAYGFGDLTYGSQHYDTDLTGIVENRLITTGADSGLGRLASSFAIFPRQGMAEVLLWPKVKMAHFTPGENAQGAAFVDAPVATHFFFGTPHQI
jgi:hypothetical protein